MWARHVRHQHILVSMLRVLRLFHWAHEVIFAMKIESVGSILILLFYTVVVNLGSIRRGFIISINLMRHAHIVLQLASALLLLS